VGKKSQRSGARGKLRAHFLANLGRVLTSNELRKIAGISEWARRVRELRDEEGYNILSHLDRDDLKSNEYLLETAEQRPVIARGISGKLRRQILDRNGFTCQVCGSAAGESSGCELGKICRLQIDHELPISHGGSNEADNLRAVCVYYNREQANLKLPTSADAISVLTLIRKQPRKVQREVYEFLAKKFGKS